LTILYSNFDLILNCFKILGPETRVHWNQNKHVYVHSISQPRDTFSEVYVLRNDYYNNWNRHSSTLSLKSCVLVSSIYCQMTHSEQDMLTVVISTQVKLYKCFSYGFFLQFDPFLMLFLLCGWLCIS